MTQSGLAECRVVHERDADSVRDRRLRLAEKKGIERPSTNRDGHRLRHSFKISYAYG